jgi:hypothetical protein
MLSLDEMWGDNRVKALWKPEWLHPRNRGFREKTLLKPEFAG